MRDEVDQPILQAQRLSKRFGRSVWALVDVDLAVPQSSVTALVGPNGAGKSTLVWCWMGFETPTLGSVSVAGTEPRSRRQDAPRPSGVPAPDAIPTYYTAVSLVTPDRAMPGVALLEGASSGSPRPASSSIPSSWYAAVARIEGGCLGGRRGVPGQPWFR